MWPEPNGHDEEFIPMSRRRLFRLLSVLVTVLVVLAMIALTIGPYLIDNRARPAPPPVTTGLGV